MSDPRAHARELARDSIARGDATGWFEQLYGESQRDGLAISWVDLAPNPYLVEWLAGGARHPDQGDRALVVGCGYGDDAELLAASGFNAVAFDVAPSAIKRCQSRFPDSNVHYVVADALKPPAEWISAFDFVFEAYTVQVLQGEGRATCAASIGRMIAPGGTLLVVARSRGAGDPEGQMPWPLTRVELDGFLAPDARLTRLTELVEPGDPPVPRFVAEITRR